MKAKGFLAALVVAIAAMTVGTGMLSPAVAASETCQVDVRSFPAPIKDLDLGFHHLLIVFTNAEGQTVDFQAGPEYLIKAPDAETGIYGHLVNKSGEYEVPDKPSVTVLAGADACGKNLCLLEKSNQIFNAKINYMPLGTNSNAYVYTLLKSCGLPLEKPTYAWQLGLTPGWNIDLLAGREAGISGIAVSVVATGGGGAGVGGGRSVDVTITNTGSASLNLGRITATDVVSLELGQSCSGTTVAPRSTCTFDAGYLLSGTEPSVSIPSNAPASPTVVPLPT